MNCRGNFTLDGAESGLHLPTMKIRAIVREDELPHLHIRWTFDGWKQVHTQPEHSAGALMVLGYTFCCRSQQ
jgi:hypothetical protein